MLDYFLNISCSRPEGLQLFYKETPTQVFSSETCEIFKNTFFKNILERLRLYLHVILSAMHEQDTANNP